MRMGECGRVSVCHVMSACLIICKSVCACVRVCVALQDVGGVGEGGGGKSQRVQGGNVVESEQTATPSVNTYQLCLRACVC